MDAHPRPYVFPGAPASELIVEPLPDGRHEVEFNQPGTELDGFILRDGSALDKLLPAAVGLTWVAYRSERRR